MADYDDEPMWDGEEDLEVSENRLQISQACQLFKIVLREILCKGQLAKNLAIYFTIFDLDMPQKIFLRSNILAFEFPCRRFEGDCMLKHVNFEEIVPQL